MSNVLIVEDDDSLREALTDTVELAGYAVRSASSGEDALVMIEQKRPSIVISDIRMDGMSGHALLKAIQNKAAGVPVLLITAHGTIHDAVDAMRSGAVDYLLKPFEPSMLLDKLTHYVREDNDAGSISPIAEDPLSLDLINLALKVADSDATVLISGESGTGKEVLARFIHDHSSRSKAPFIAINCAAIPEQMLEATLFGHEKGAFTGAHKAAVGKFEQAQHGTILLDEISEMDLNLQAKLLRVLQEKEVERIGSSKLIQLDVRVLATTNRDMKSEIKAGRFREDLYYRLNVFPLHWRPLRERVGDILPMADYLIKRHWPSEKGPLPTFSKKAADTLRAYGWPGNAREMDNVIQRALILLQGDTIEVDNLHLLSADETSVVDIASQSPPETTHQTPSSNQSDNQLSDSILLHEFTLIEQALKDNQGSRQVVANLLGVSERTLRYKLAKMREKGFDV